VTDDVDGSAYCIDYGSHIFCLAHDVISPGVVGTCASAATVHRMHREVPFEPRRDARPPGVIRRGPVDEQ
jgi:hypothetical protein